MPAMNALCRRRLTSKRYQIHFLIDDYCAELTDAFNHSTPVRILIFTITSEIAESPGSLDIALEESKPKHAAEYTETVWPMQYIDFVNFYLCSIFFGIMSSTIKHPRV